MTINHWDLFYFFLGAQMTTLEILAELMDDYLTKFCKVYRRFTDEHDTKRGDTQEVRREYLL
jgi:hypothetical protein